MNLENSFIRQCKELLPIYLNKVIGPKTTSQTIELNKKVVINFLKAYYASNQSKYNRNNINLKYIHSYLSHPDLKGLVIRSENLTTVRNILVNFLNFLSLQQILKKKDLNDLKEEILEEKKSKEKFRVLDENDLEHSEQSYQKIQFCPEILIHDIEPLEEYLPYSKTYDDFLFNFPKDLRFDLDTYWHQVITLIKNSDEERIRFYFSRFEDFDNTLSTLDEEDLISAALEHYRSENYQKAIKLINKLLKEHPSHTSLLSFKGDVLKAQTFEYNALRYYLKSLKTNPVIFNLYKYLAIQFQCGGYFYHSQQILIYLLKIKPLDYQLNFYMAYNSYQLLRPFKNYLYLAFLISPHYSKNLFDEDWIRERFEPRDSLKNISLSDVEFNKLSQSAYDNALTYYELFDKNFQFLNPLFYFPSEQEHIKKNWYRFEVITSLLINIYSVYHKSIKNLKDLILCKDFGYLLFIISKDLTNLNLPKRNLERNEFILPKEGSLENLVRSFRTVPFFELILTYIPEDHLVRILTKTLESTLRECGLCSYDCLHNGSDHRSTFTDYPGPKENLHYDKDGFPERFNQEQLIKSLSNGQKEFMEKLLIGYENHYLEVNPELELSINSKNQIKIFLISLISIYNIDNLQRLRRYLNINFLLKYLGFWIIKTKIVDTEKSMRVVIYNLKLFFKYIHEKVRLFSENKIKMLLDALNSEEFFIERFNEFLEINNKIPKRNTYFHVWSRSFLLWYDWYHTKNSSHQNKKKKIRLTEMEASHFKRL